MNGSVLVSDGDGSLSPMKDDQSKARVFGLIVWPASLCFTFPSGHWCSVASNSTSEMSLLECGHPGTFCHLVYKRFQSGHSCGEI